MYTSYEERLALIQALQEGANSFLATIPNAVHRNGDGWELASIGSQFFNPNATKEKLMPKYTLEVSVCYTFDVVADSEPEAYDMADLYQDKPFSDSYITDVSVALSKNA